MKQEINYINPASLDISVEDFDALEGVHEFSKEYKKKKRKMLKEYRRSIFASTKHIYIKVAMAMLFLLVVSVPIITYAAANGEFFNRIWGNKTKENIKSHDQVLYDEQNLPFQYTFPEREFVSIDPDKAEELIGSHVSYETVVKKLGDTKFTILSSVHDGNVAVVEFKLERKGGVNAFNYSQTDNEYQGARFSYDPTFWFHFPTCSENILVDLERSTKDVLYCYNYMTMAPDSYNPKTKGVTLEVCEYPCTRWELFSADEEAFDRYKKNTKTSNITVPFCQPVKTTEYVNADGGKISISPLGMRIDMDTGLGLSNEEGYDPENIYYVSVNYKNEKNYIVQEHELQGVHSCETKIDNSSAYSSDSWGNLSIVFNRLIDPEKVESITVNDTTYTLK